MPEPEKKEPDQLVIQLPKIPAILQRLSAVVAEARTFAVMDLASHQMALERVKALRTGEREFTDLFEDARKDADRAKKSVLSIRDGFVAPLAEARDIYIRSARNYKEEEERKAEKERQRLQELAREQEEERKLAAAQEAQDAGNIAEAEAIIEEELQVSVHVKPQIATVKGVVEATLWSAKVTDVRACLKYMLERPEWLPLLERLAEVLEAGLRGTARAQHEAMNIPGAVAVSTKSTRS